ncbi:MAG TPA: MMPL family transporter, partial [Dongiaceae bacterium]|nr:MMPL family transporter [Dongiaceae bacterium]
ELMQAANHLKEDLLQDYPGLTLHFNGDVAIEDAILQVTMEDMLWVNPLVFITIFLLVGVFLRSRVAIVSTVAVVGISTFISMGILVMLGFDINPITMMAPAVIMVLAVLDSVHIMTQYIINLGEGMEKTKAMMSSLKKNASPVFWTSATDAVGFLSMNFGDSPPFRDMGNMASIGVMIAFVVTYTVLPGVALLFSDKIEAKPLVLAEMMRKLTGAVLRIHGVVLWGVLAGIAYMAYCIPELNVNDDLSTYFDDSLEIQDSLKFARQNIEGVQYILYSVGGERAGQVNEPEFLHQTEQFEHWLEQQPEVSGVDSYLDLLRRINQAMHNDDPAESRLPDDRALAAQYLLLYEMSLPEGMDLTRDLSEDRSSLRMVVNVRKSDNQTLIGLERRAEQWLQQNQPTLKVEGTSELLMFAHMGTSIILSMMDGSLFTLIFVTAMMMIGLRSFKFGLISMIPNVAPPIVIYGLWTLTVGQVNHAVAMTFSITMGLIVDDTIHLMSKYLNGRREGLSPEQAIAESLATSGAAVVVSSLTLGAGFLLLSLSRFTVNDTLSIMTAGIIFMALLFDLIFLPVLLVQLDRFLTGRNPVPALANPDASA